MTESIYQSLRPFFPEDTTGADTRSIHFLAFPAVNEQYFDPAIEQQVARMQAVIELTRYVREKNTLSLKVRSALFVSVRIGWLILVSRLRSGSCTSSTPIPRTFRTSNRFNDTSNRNSMFAMSYSRLTKRHPG